MDLPAPKVAWYQTISVGVHGQRAVMWPPDTHPPAQWRYVGRTIEYAAVMPTVFPAAPHGQADLHDAVLGQFFGALREAGYVWFAGATRPARGEGALVLGGASAPPVKPDAFGRRVLIGVPPVTLVENPSGTVLWQADGEAKLTTIRNKDRRRRNPRTALLPGARGQRPTAGAARGRIRPSAPVR